MRITISFCTFLLLTYIAHGSLADKVVAKVNEHENGWNEAVKDETIEERGYITNKQIQNKFIRQNNRITAAEAEIETLKANQASIGDSLLIKCQQLDKLLHPDNHCCKTDFTVLCVSNYLATNLFPFSDLTQGACPECPIELVAGGTN